MKIFVLDDMNERHFGFSVIYAGHEIIKAYNVNEAIKILDEHRDFDLIHLDHSLQDFEYFPQEENRKPRERTGMEVVDYILNTNYPKDVEIIIHSWDIEPARMMGYRLGRAGYRKTTKRPYKSPV